MNAAVSGHHVCLACIIGEQRFVHCFQLRFIICKVQRNLTFAYRHKFSAHCIQNRRVGRFPFKEEVQRNSLRPGSTNLSITSNGLCIFNDVSDLICSKFGECVQIVQFIPVRTSNNFIQTCRCRLVICRHFANPFFALIDCFIYFVKFSKKVGIAKDCGFVVVTRSVIQTVFRMVFVIFFTVGVCILFTVKVTRRVGVVFGGLERTIGGCRIQHGFVIQAVIRFRGCFVIRSQVREILIPLAVVGICRPNDVGGVFRFCSDTKHVLFKAFTREGLYHNINVGIFCFIRLFQHFQYFFFAHFRLTCNGYFVLVRYNNVSYAIATAT